MRGIPTTFSEFTNIWSFFKFRPNGRDIIFRKRMFRNNFFISGRNIFKNAFGGWGPREAVLNRAPFIKLKNTRIQFKRIQALART